MDKVFAVAGVSTLDKVTKARFAKDMGRVKVLEKNGHKNVRLMELPKPMVKSAAVAFLLSHKDFKDAVAQTALKAYEGDEAPVVVKAPKVASKTETKAKAAPKTETKAKAAPNTAATETVVEIAQAPAEKTEAEIAAIKAKNLATLKKVGKSWEDRRNTEGEVMLLEAEAEIDARTEAGIPDYRWAGIGIED